MGFSGFICSTPVYEFEGWTFEYGYTGGPWPLKKNGELRKKAGRKFWAMFYRFSKLSDDEKYAHRVGGGCQSFGG